MKLFSTYTNKIILVNAALFLVLRILMTFFNADKIIYIFALQPALVLAGKNLWTIITSMFFHIEAWHVLANMISVFFLGTFIERLIGKKRFLWLYLLSGIFAGIFYALLAFFFGNSVIGARIFGDPLTYALGASGAIFGLLGLLAVLIPEGRVSLIAGPLIALIIGIILELKFSSSVFVTIFNLALILYSFFIIYAIFSFDSSLRKYIIPIEMPFWLLPIVAIAPLIIIGIIFPLPIGNTAHLGGLIVGLFYGFYLKSKYPRKTKMISRFFSKQ
ncbi:MAG: rhomboid family intramembrane serine protease [Nanoarchaeota archaeon]